uniref:Uncharacterized protein n=1 Tax=Picea glauca TaxID=3330 RepID=A0A101LZN3_PICGL|nr:hypothetical protein ABT39_MTgene5279 [Picea glauca]
MKKYLFSYGNWKWHWDKHFPLCLLTGIMPDRLLGCPQRRPLCLLG